MNTSLLINRLPYSECTCNLSMSMGACKSQASKLQMCTLQVWTLLCSTYYAELLNQTTCNVPLRYQSLQCCKMSDEREKTKYGVAKLTAPCGAA